MARTLEAEVVVVGAGPVGLVVALVLKRAGVDVQVFDTNRRTGVHSYAVVLHPGTQALLDTLGLMGSVGAHGVAVTKVGLYEGAERRGEIDISALGGRHKQLFVLPQSRLELLLEDALAALGTKVHWLHRVQDLKPRADGVDLTVARLDSVSTGYPIARSEQVVAGTVDVSSSWLVGADGYDSFVRRRLGIPMEESGGHEIVSVYQCEAGGPLPQEGRLMLARTGVGAYWPLPGGRCRMSFPIASEADHKPDPSGFAALLQAQAPWFTAEIRSLEWTASARFERRLAARFGAGRVWLAGDAAHLTAPAGAQSMNVGLREAEDLGGRLVAVLRRGAPASSLAEYDAEVGRTWRRLLSRPSPSEGAPAPWASRFADRIAACLPGSGDDLDALLRQIGMELPPAS